MVKNHLKAIAAPRNWPIARKAHVFVGRPDVGRKLEHSLPLTVVIRDLLKYANTSKETKTILLKDTVLVDGRQRKSRNFPVGLLDVIEFPKLKESYRLILSKKGKLKLIKTKESESALKICKIVKKTKLKGGKTQLNLFDGKNILTKDDYSVGGSVLLKMPENKIQDHFPLEKNVTIYLTGGKHIGETGKVQEIKGTVVSIKSGSTIFESKKEQLIVVGKEKAAINVEVAE